MSKKFRRRLKKIAVPVALVAAAVFTGGAALGAFGAAGAAGASTAVGSLAGGAGMIQSAIGATVAGKASMFSTFGSFVAGKVFPVLRAASAAKGLLGGSAVQKAPSPVGDTTAVNAAAEEAKRKRAMLANQSNRQSTIRAGALADRPTLGSAGSLG